VASVATWTLKPVPVPGPVESIRFQIPIPEKTNLGLTGAFALSPDGRQLAFMAAGSDGAQRISVRALDSLDARALPGTESAVPLPFSWSPDSRFIAFYADGKLKKISVSGGPAEKVCDIFSGVLVGGSWNRDGVIIFGTSGQGGTIMRVSAAGGTPTPLTKIDRSRSETGSHVFPWFLPDGRHFLYLRGSSVAENTGIYAGSLDSKPEEQSLKLLVPTQYAPVYVPSSNPDLGHLLFVRDGTLTAQPFDARRLELFGEATTLAEGLGAFLNYGFFSASNNGVLAYRAVAGGSYQLTWYDRQGKAFSTTGEPTDLVLSARLSPDGTHVAVSREDAGLHVPALWLIDLSRGTSERFTFGSAAAENPVWSPDGSRIIFASLRDGKFDLYQKVASGATDEQPLLRSSEDKHSDSWSHDGRFLLYTVINAKTKDDLWVLPLEGDKKPFPFLETEFNERYGQFSPDGRWVAYSSDESGRDEIYVRPFSSASGETASSAAGKWLISNGGGSHPIWRRDGRELYYIAANRDLMAVEVTTNPTFQAGIPKVLFQAPPLVSGPSYSQSDVTADGKRFLLTAPAAQFAQAPFTVITNWQAALKK
jgi:Tol biopolymer transport system component